MYACASCMRELAIEKRQQGNDLSGLGVMGVGAEYFDLVATGPATNSYPVHSLSCLFRDALQRLYSVEHDKRQPSVRTLTKIARALGVEVKDFFS
jgi:transcriptional regulator with XRE-family HTH domain